ncbi:MAG: hypothetical protein LBH16_12475 [Treponema sp.]|jgi:hypothetical protein|nr:hypothetical protein [Treponema sp.]
MDLFARAVILKEIRAKKEKNMSSCPIEKNNLAKLTKSLYTVLVNEKYQFPRGVVNE